MKIPAHILPTAARTGAAASQPSARSFGELIEGGASARTIAGARALGFGETGLMGLRFAALVMRDGTEGGAGAVVSEPTETPVRGHAITTAETQAAPALVSDARELRVGCGPVRPLSTVACGQGSILVLSTEAAPVASRAPIRTAPTPKHEAASGTSFTARLGRQIAVRFPRAKSAQISLRSGNGGLEVWIEGMEIGTKELLEFERISRRIAAELGVTISRVLVKYSEGLRDAR
ncbi:MAG TPA: hypothetical protein VF440_13575 [Novosphingobium sp.]